MRSSCVIHVLVRKDTGKNLLSLSQKRAAIYEPESGPLPDTEYVGTLILDFLASRPVRNKFLIFMKCLFYDSLLQQPDLTRIII